MEYKEELQRLYLKLNEELIILRSHRIQKPDNVKMRIDSLLEQMKMVKEQLDDFNKQSKEGGKANDKPRVGR